MEELEGPRVDFLLLADRAEAVNGKLYMVGGGWDQINVVDWDAPTALSIAVGIAMPQDYADTPTELRIHLEALEGDELGPEIRGQITVPLPDGLDQEMPLRSVIAINTLWGFERAGIYRMRAQLGQSPPAEILLQVNDAGRQD